MQKNHRPKGSLLCTSRLITCPDARSVCTPALPSFLAAGTKAPIQRGNPWPAGAGRLLLRARPGQARQGAPSRTAILLVLLLPGVLPHITANNIAGIARVRVQPKQAAWVTIVAHEGAPLIGNIEIAQPDPIRRTPRRASQQKSRHSCKMCRYDQQLVACTDHIMKLLTNPLQQ